MRMAREMENQSYEELLIDLMEEYGDMVLRVAYTYVKERQLAEDLSQEVFLKCYGSLHKFENRSSYKTWLYQITVNACKDYVRSWSFRNLIPWSGIKRENNLIADSVLTHLVTKEDNIHLFKNVLKLSVKLREVLIFYYYEDLSIQEIGDILQVKPSTVKTRLFRARENLKELLGGGIYDEE